MSVLAMKTVFEHSQHSGTELLMLLAIADFADDDGRAYPSVPTLAKKTRMQPRNANYVLAELQRSGELSVLRNAGPRGANLYRINLVRLHADPAPGCSPAHDCTPEADCMPAKECTPAPDCTEPLQPSAQSPASECRLPLHPAAAEPPVNHQGTVRGSIKKRPSKSAHAGANCDTPPLPAWVTTDDWQAFQHHRRQLRKPMTPEAERRCLVDLDALRAEGHDPAAVINQSIVRGWAGLFPIKRGPSPNRLDSRAAAAAGEAFESISSTPFAPYPSKQQLLEARNRAAVEAFVREGEHT